MSSYAEGLLSSGEHIELRARQHPFVIRRSVVTFVIMAIVAMTIAYIGASAGGSASTIAFVVGLAILFVGIARLTKRWLAWRAEEYLITNYRVIKVEGIINKRSADSSIEKINDAMLTQSLFGRMFNYGNLAVMTAADAAVDKFFMLHDPLAFKKAMLDAKFAYGMDHG